MKSIKNNNRTRETTRLIGKTTSNRCVMLMCMLAAVFLFATWANADVIVEWSGTNGPYWYATGKLASVKSQIGNNGAGIHYFGFVPSASISGSQYACCDAEGKPTREVYLTAPVANQIIKVAFKGTYKLVEWYHRSTYGAACSRAGQHWDDLHKDTEKHEQQHHSMTQGHYTQASVSPVVEAAQYELTSVCVNETEVDNTKNQLRIELLSVVLSAVQAHVNAEENPNTYDNTDTVWPYTTINASLDCPNIPVVDP